MRAAQAVQAVGLAHVSLVKLGLTPHALATGLVMRLHTAPTCRAAMVADALTNTMATRAGSLAILRAHQHQQQACRQCRSQGSQQTAPENLSTPWRALVVQPKACFVV